MTEHHAKLIKKDSPQAAQLRRGKVKQKPSCPNNEVKQWIQDRLNKRTTQQTQAYQEFAALFVPATPPKFATDDC